MSNKPIEWDSVPVMDEFGDVTITHRCQTKATRIDGSINLPPLLKGFQRTSISYVGVVNDANEVVGIDFKIVDGDWGWWRKSTQKVQSLTEETDLLNFEPLNDRVIIEPEEAVKKIGSILIPDTAQKKTLRGKVIAIGPGKLLKEMERSATGSIVCRLPMTLDLGDTVIYESFAGNTIEHDGKTYIAFREDEIIAKVKQA